jgi:putative ABC transport system permease protein
MSVGTLWLLVRRGLRASWGAAAVLATVSLVAALVLTSLPRAVERWHTAMLDHAASQVSAISRDIRLTPTGAPRSFTDRNPNVLAAPPWDVALSWLEDVREDLPEPLHGTVGRPHVTVSAPEVPVAPAPGLGISAVRLVLRGAPDLADHARLIEGAWPEPSPVVFRWGEGADGDGADGVGADDDADDDLGVTPTQIALSRAGASTIGWTLGSVHELPPPFPPVTVVGIYEPAGGTVGYFEHATYGSAPLIVTDPMSGTTVTLAGAVAPEVILPLALGSPQLTLWYPVDLSDVAGNETRTLLDQTRRLTAASLESSGLDGLPVRVSTGATDLLGRVLAQQVSVDAVLAVTAAGPVGALLVVLALGARLVVERRRQALALLHARGASDRAVRTVAAAEGAVAGLPGAAVGMVVGLLLVPGTVSAGQVVLASVAGLAPAVALTLTASTARLGVGRRADLGRGGRWRVTGEALVMIAAAVSTWFLVARGAVGAGGAAGGTARAERVDPLVVVAPALLCLAVALLVVRALPWLVAPLERALARRRGLVGFLGAARARRDPAGGVLPAVALVLCVAVGASSSVLSTTVDAGMSDAAWERVGADVRVSDVWISPEQVAGLRAADGVDAVATLGTFGAGTVTSDGAQERVAVVAVDASALARVQDGVPGAVEASTLAALTRDTVDGALPVLASSTTGLPDAAAGDLARDGSTKEPVPVRSVGTIDVLPGMPPARKFLVVDAARAAEAFGLTYLPGVAFVRLDARAAATAGVPPALTAVVDTDTARWETATGAATELAASPAPRALRTAATLALALAAGLVAMAVVLTLLLAGPARARLLAVLRSLGAGGRQGRSLVVWETAPWVVVALVAGAVLAWAVPAVVLAAVDLTVLTGGSAQPLARYDPGILVGLGAGLVLVAVVAGGVVAVRSGRDVAAQLRTGGDG